MVEEIVRLGDALLPTLPESHRLPTTALFQAAEQILPEHGYDAENTPSHISRLIFKIGGQRTGETLGDKFRAVLAGMNIQVEYIPSSPFGESSAASPALSSSYAVSGRFDFGPRRVPRRRHSSVSQPLGRSLQPDLSDYDLPIRHRDRPRSVSPTELIPSSAGHSRLGARNAQLSDRNRDTGLSSQWNPVAGRNQHAITSADFVWKECVPPQKTVPQVDIEYDGDEPDETDEIPPGRPFQSYFPTMERVRHPSREFRDMGRGAGNPVPLDNKGLLESPLIIPNAHPAQHSPRTDGSEGFRGTSDTTAQSQDDRFIPSPYEEQPAIDTDDLEARLYQFRMEYAAGLHEDAFYVWHDIAVEARRNNRELHSRATKYDDIDIIGEVLEAWLDITIAAQEARQLELAAAEREAYVVKMEKRASRVYEIVTVRSALAYWQDCAREETDRTAVARRHLVRKRAFDGWRAQHVEDESKVTNFVLLHALQKWSQAALHHEIRNQVAARRYRHNLAMHTFDTVWRQYKGICADDFRRYHMVESCLDAWFTRTRAAQVEHDVAVTVDERLLLDEVVNIWREETEDLQYTAYDSTVQQLSRDCQRMLRVWHEQSMLVRLLRQYNASRELILQQRALTRWRDRTLKSQRENWLADILVLESPLDFWKKETKLRIFNNSTDRRVKLGVVAHWYREERLAWYLRYSEKNVKRNVLNRFLSAARGVRDSRVQAQQDADRVSAYYTKRVLFETWQAGVDQMWRYRYNANVIDLYRTAKPCMHFWRERRQLALARDTYLGRLADGNSTNYTLANVLDRWPGMAALARRERMMSSLRQFRRNYKVELARSCFDTWLRRTHIAREISTDARSFHARSRKDDINGCLDFWSATIRMAREIWEVAAVAEMEIYLGTWQSHIRELQGDKLDAIYWDAEQTLGDCCRKWELQALQMQSQQQTVAAVRSRNQNRLCRQILDGWHQKAVPDSANLDLQLSTMSRRSMRFQHQHQQAARSTSSQSVGQQQQEYPAPPPPSSILRPQRSMAAPETPRLPVSQLGFPRIGSSARFSSSRRDLGPMTEFDEDESPLPGLETNDPGFMSTPTRWTGSARPLGYRPTTTPSAILPSPYERELRREYGQSRRVEFADIEEASLED